MINNLTVNYIDVIILLPLVYGAYKGFSLGLIVEMSTLFALVLGVFISLRYAVNVEGFLKDFVALPESYAYYIAFAVTFLLVIIVPCAGNQRRGSEKTPAGYYRDASAWKIVDQVD